MSEIQNPYDIYIRHYAMRAWTKSVVTKVTRLHQLDCDFDFSDGFFNFFFFSDLAICNHVTFVTEFISSSWEYGMSEIQNPYDIYIRHYAMRAWTKSVVTKVTRLHQSDCDF